MGPLKSKGFDLWGAGVCSVNATTMCIINFDISYNKISFSKTAT